MCAHELPVGLHGHAQRPFADRETRVPRVLGLLLSNVCLAVPAWVAVAADATCHGVCALETHQG